MLSADELRKAMRRAFDLGQTYLMHADSESIIQHQKADRVRERFDALMEETVAATCGVLGREAPNLRRAAERAERVLDQVSTDIAATAQLIEWHAPVEEVRDALRIALGEQATPKSSTGAASGPTNEPQQATPGVALPDGGQSNGTR